MFFSRSDRECPDVKIADFGLARKIGTKYNRTMHTPGESSYFPAVPPGRTSFSDGMHSPGRHGRMAQTGSWRGPTSGRYAGCRLGFG